MSRRLSGLDGAFLALETAHSNGHVGGLSILDPAPVEIDLERLARQVASRLHLVPVLRQRLRAVPLGLERAVWADDEDFDIGYHVRAAALPAPHGRAELGALVARLHERPLDQSRPLWEIYLISGLRHGRCAVYTKLHHAMMDGISGAELLTVLFDVSPDPVEGVGPDFVPAPGPGSVDGGLAAVRRLARSPADVARLWVDAVRSLPGLVPGAVSTLRRLARAAQAHPVGGVTGSGPLVAPTTPLNVTITAHRRFAYGSLSLAEVRMVKDALGVSVNDVVLGLTAGVVRRWLQERSALPDKPLVVMVPVSLRRGSSDFGGNEVSAVFPALPTNVADPVERVLAAHAVTRAAKAHHRATPQPVVDDLLDLATPVVAGAVATLIFGLRVMNRFPLFNIVVSNVPGPPVPVYVAGAAVVAHYPLSVVTDGLALNVTLLGYRDRLHFGLVADREAVPDVEEILGNLQVELDALTDAVADR